MKRNLKLKSYVIPTLYVFLFIATFYLTLVISNSLTKRQTTTESENQDYVSETILQNNKTTDKEEQPVINEKENTIKIIKPFTNDKVKIGKFFYSSSDESERQENSITYHDNTYIQNTGVDYTLEETFDVVSVLDGTVTSVKTDDLLGKIVEITHDNNYISVYQSLSSVDVKKGDTVKQGATIGKSGTNEMDKDMGNHLHFELYIKGVQVDPTEYIDKELTDTDKSDSEEETKTEE